MSPRFQMPQQDSQGACGQARPAGALQAEPRSSQRTGHAAAGRLARGSVAVGGAPAEAYPKEWIQGQLVQQQQHRWQQDIAQVN